MENKERFLVDANILITAKNSFYPFDLARAFWEQLKYHVEQKDIIILKKMADEIFKGEDELTEWLKQFDDRLFLTNQDSEILAEYGNVLQHLKDSPYYKEPAWMEWSRDSVADPWLIAAARAKGYTLVTLEVSAGRLSIVNKSRKAKINDICKEMKVPCKDLYYMMRQLGIKL